MKQNRDKAVKIIYFRLLRFIPMQREFTLSIFYKIFYCLFGGGLIFMSLFFVANPRPESGLAIYLIPLMMLPVGSLLVAVGLRRKVIIENDVITATDMFNTREICLEDIKGVRTGNKTLVIESKIAGQKPIYIRSYIQLTDSFELMQYLRGTYEDLDGVDLENEKNNLLQDTNLGFTSEDRQARLNNAKTIALLYNILGVILAALGFVFKEPNYVIVLMIYPMLSIVVMLTSKGLIKFLSEKKRSVYPFVFVGFIAPTIILFVKSTTDFHVFSYDNFWLPYLSMLCVIFLLLFAAGINRALSAGVVMQGLMMFVISIFYAFGVVGQVNCDFDTSPDHVYKASVLGHHVTHGKNTSYYLYLSTWGPCHEQKEVRVSSAIYENTSPGDSVKVDLKAGLLNIPWFVVKR